ncbi:peptidase [Actinoplanes sp. NBRC 103695]|nr:peptidase [Actinoplanes sp. NBRC 103695]
MGRVRNTRPILVVLLLVLGLPLIGLPVAPALASSEKLDWQPCADDGTAQCATLRVPIRTGDDGYGEKLPIAVARRTAARPALRIGTLIVNPGGPGSSGVDMVLGAAGFFSPALRARFDIVSFDPRGVGRSTPVVCARSLLDAGPSPIVRSKAAYTELVAHHRELTRDCAKRSGPVYRHADSLSVAGDMELLRRALGEKQISFYGASYGTLLGAQYAERYPGRVRALVLDSVIDHSVGTKEFLADGTAAVQDSFEQFVSWCARYKACVLHGRNVRAMWSALLVRAAAGTVVDPYRPAFRPTVFDLLDIALGSFYGPQWDALAYYIDEASAPTPAARRAAEDEERYSFPAIFCSDFSFPRVGYASYARRLADLRATAPAMPVSPLALSAVAACLGATGPAANPQREFRPATVPTLLVGSYHDPATPYVWSQRAAAQLGSSASLLTYVGWGHVSYGRTACVTGHVDRYLVNLIKPAAGARCPGVLPAAAGVG